MADAWLPTAARLPVDVDGGALRGGAPRVVWFTTETDPRLISARSAAYELAKHGTPAHLVWNPLAAEIVQQLPLTRAACLLPAPVRGEGRICLQIMVVGLARDPFTGGPLGGLDAIMRWLDGWQVARRWPAGPPLPPPQSYLAGRDRRRWARGGHFGCSQVPEIERPDPGALDIRRITGQQTPVAEIPRPRPASGHENSAGLAPLPRLPIPPEPVLSGATATRSGSGSAPSLGRVDGKARARGEETSIPRPTPSRSHAEDSPHQRATPPAPRPASIPS